MYPLRVKFPPVSINVLKPEIAYHQSEREKKSDFTLKDPHNVHKKGKTEIVNHKIINTEFIIIN